MDRRESRITQFPNRVMPPPGPPPPWSVSIELSDDDPTDTPAAAATPAAKPQGSLSAPPARYGMGLCPGLQHGAVGGLLSRLEP